MNERAPIPADGLLHLLPLIGIALLIVNDHVLKAAWPGVVTGKVSDVAGLLFFPLFLQAAAEVVPGRWRVPVADRRVLAVAIIATAVVFVSIKLVPVAGDLYTSVAGLLQWPIAMAGAWLRGTPVPVQPVATVLTQDASDLIALFALIPVWIVGSRRSRMVDERHA